MTFSVIAHCPKTGKLGFVSTTSTPGVGGRCGDVAPGFGVVAVQALADARQLRAARQHLESGLAAQEVLAKLEKDDEYFDFRQIAIVDVKGGIAVRTGSRAKAWKGEVVGPNFVALGNMIVGEKVVEAMAETYAANEYRVFEDRLLTAIEAGRDAGGQANGQTSSALLVYDNRYGFPTVNLRVDVDAEPVGKLRTIFDWFQPLIPYYVERTLDPASVALSRDEFMTQRGLRVNPFR
jgi:uncharacterized Ntn-hydrolase superfamily protein